MRLCLALPPLKELQMVGSTRLLEQITAQQHIF